MTTAVFLALDLVAVVALVAVYFRRHHRRDLVVSYLCVNIGVLAVTQVLAVSTVGAGLGLGLFGVLSIIRLRSSEIAQHEVAYYFAALAVGLLAGFGAVGSTWVPAALIILVVAVMAAADHPRLLRRYRQQVIVLDRAIADETELAAHLGHLLGAEVKGVTVQRLDLVNDTTTVDVRYRTTAGVPAAAARPRLEVAS
ncbi:DUF4956 domain-containing protein [Nakamurella sp. YIM 132087]|uniref:DUF4956 domain-containing protein n=1 Tax=Nakamurella alba TaxID=2665158 RepID=A0A7K1FMV9_9ACTN|nr:DUF4956 domain-containing protein [Nakamurella alba]MTD14573.1 DUF4956 domain-containing protein [Nakamurella alba]